MRFFWLGAVLLTLLVAAAPARAQFNPFAAYYHNVARAAAKDDTALVVELAGTGNNPNATHRGYTALHYAAMFGNTEMIDALVKAGARIDERDRLGNTPLLLAAVHRHAAATKRLLAAGADINAQNHDGMTALMLAAEHGDLRLVRLLLAHRADPSIADYSGRTAASWAEASERRRVAAAIREAAARR